MGSLGPIFGHYAVRKVIYLAIRKASERWTRPLNDWPAALNHFAIVFEGRVPR